MLFISRCLVDAYIHVLSHICLFSTDLISVEEHKNVQIICWLQSKKGRYPKFTVQRKVDLTYFKQSFVMNLFIGTCALYCGC